VVGSSQFVSGQALRSLRAGSVVAQVVDGNAGEVHVAGVEWLGLDELQVVEPGDADGAVGQIVAVADLVGAVSRRELAPAVS
jgi:hypothetical protein